MTKSKQLAIFILEQFRSSEDARQWMIAWAWTLERIGEAGRAWTYRQAAAHLAVVTS